MLFSRKKGHEPGPVHAIAEAILGLALGVVIAATWLIFKPVEIVDEPATSEEAPAPARHAIRYVQGRQAPVRESTWRAKQRAFLGQDGRGLELFEQDLNRWLVINYAELDLNRKWESVALETRVGIPAFRFDGAGVEVGMVCDVAFMETWKRRLVVQASGSFVDRGGVYAFVPDRVWVGSCPVPFAALSRAVYDWAAAHFVLPEDTAASWAAIRDLRVEASRMQIGFKTAAAPPAIAAEPVPGPKPDTGVGQAAPPASPAPPVARPQPAAHVPAPQPRGARPAVQAAAEDVAPAGSVAAAAPAP